MANSNLSTGLGNLPLRASNPAPLSESLKTRTRKGKKNEMMNPVGKNGGRNQGEEEGDILDDLSKGIVGNSNDQAQSNWKGNIGKVAHYQEIMKGVEIEERGTRLREEGDVGNKGITGLG
ncbi:hypothetical protein DFH28DRAFT_921524 [Melampsora americana]|nr:hypothetical protein DFH28DRAFT_921524 [Melampsora americana]